jgi:gliding motility-associated lipoprotein GldH
MIKRLSIFGICFLTILISSCHFYKEYDKESFPTYSWEDRQEIVFTPIVEDVSKNYQVILGVRHHYAFQNNTFGVNIRIVSPSGKETNKNYDLKIKDESNKPIASCAGDICDLETLVFGDFKFEEAGEYKVIIRHNERGHRIAGIMEVGLIIDEKN